MSLENKKILLIIGGGISAYKSLDLIRMLQRKGSSVKVVLTKSGKSFLNTFLIESTVSLIDSSILLENPKKILNQWYYNGGI